MNSMRILLVAGAALWLCGCTAMMVGGGNSGGYEPPPDECSGKNRDSDRCKSGVRVELPGSRPT